MKKPQNRLMALVTRMTRGIIPAEPAGTSLVPAVCASRAPAATGGTTILVLDVSSSMLDMVYGEATKLQLLCSALPATVAKMERSGVQYAAILLFSQTIALWQSVRTLREIAGSLPTADVLKSQPHFGGSTSLVDALLFGLAVVERDESGHGPYRIVAMTDGVENSSTAWPREGSHLKLYRQRTKDSFKAARRRGIFVGLTGFTSGTDKVALMNLAEELGITAEVAQHDGRAASVSQSVSDACDTMSTMASGCWPLHDD